MQPSFIVYASQCHHDTLNQFSQSRMNNEQIAPDDLLQIRPSKKFHRVISELLGLPMRVNLNDIGMVECARNFEFTLQGRFVFRFTKRFLQQELHGISFIRFLINDFPDLAERTGSDTVSKLELIQDNIFRHVFAPI